jgi:hypothetical protein
MRENKSLTNQTLDSHRKTKTKDQDLLYPCRSAQIRGKLSPQKNTARTSHPSRIVRRTLSACLPAARRRDNGTGPTALTGSATFTSTSCKIAIRRIAFPQLIAAGQRPYPLIERAVGGRSAQATGTRSRAFSDFPWQIHPRELPAATSVTAIIVRQALRVPTFSMNPLCGRTLRLATENRFALVQKLWRMSLPCGSLRKLARELRPRNCAHEF